MSNNPTTRGSALLITLTLVVLLTILAVGMISMARLERVSARNTFASVQARALTDAAADHAMTLVRDAIFNAEKTTGSNTPASARKFWASQPGKITVFNSDGSIDAASSRALYSTNTTTLGGTVNLNAAPFGGTPPIMTGVGTNPAPIMAVPWVNLLNNPAQPASPSNAITGRYAFWVDDESTKLNVNTADGTTKDTTNSFGAGTPAEVNLQALTNTTSVGAIARQSGAQYDASTSSRAFNSIREVLQTPGINTDFFPINAQDLTVYNRAPDLNIFGEPKIYLTPVNGRLPGAGPSSASPFNSAVGNLTPLSLITGPYANFNPANPALWSLLDAQNSLRTYDASGQPLPGNHLDWIYPSSGKLIQADPTKVQTPPNSQLPPFIYRYTDSNGIARSVTTRLPQFFHEDGDTYYSALTSDTDVSGFINKAHDYDLGYRIARYLKGHNSQDQSIQWPPFPGSGTGGFSAKYTDRQIDDMACQILSVLKQLSPDHYNLNTTAYHIRRGFISGQMVRGLNRSPRLNEIIIQVTTLPGDPPKVRMSIVLEWYFPSGYKGYGLTSTISFGNWRNRVNDLDLAAAATPSDWQTTPVESRNYTITKGVLGSGYWANNMLKFVDQNGEDAGVDLMGTRADVRDLDQVKAALYHDPWARKDPDLPYNPSTNPYMGGGPPLTAGASGFFYGPLGASVAGAGLFGGWSGPVGAWKPGEYHTNINPNSTYAHSMKKGVTSIKLSGGLAVWAKSPSGHGGEIVPLESGMATGEDAIYAVIPIPDGPAIPVSEDQSHAAVYHIQVADPLVNNFPGDWEGRVWLDETFSSLASSGKITMRTTGGQVYTDGQNKRAEGQDDLTAWWPEQSLSIPKSQRFPSTGYLQFIHTGTMPDKASETAAAAAKASGDLQWRRKLKGTPYRLLNFSPSTAVSQQTDGGESYPDWAMLDLFTTPAIFQPQGNPLPLPIIRTWGGATAGRLNPNAVLEPFGIARTKPLEALFKGVNVSLAYNSAGEAIQTTVTHEADLAKAITDYVDDLKRPLMLPGEICNIDQIAQFVYPGVPANARSRNDLVRQTVGNLTTRSNTFTVWAIGEVIQKKSGNGNYAIFEPGDTILGRSRARYVIERYLDPGSDGIYGNTVNPGTDGVPNTPDDSVTTASGAHPVMTYPLPYKYRILSVTQVE